MTRRRWRRWKHPSRDAVLFIVGILGIIYETGFDNIDRPSLLVVFSAMIGLPAFLHQDEARQPHDDDPPPEPPAKVEK